MKRKIFITVIGIICLGSGCLSPKIPILTESEASSTITKYSFDIKEGSFSIGLNPPTDHVVLGSFSLSSATWSPQRSILEICPKAAAEKNEINPEVSGSGLACEDAWVWIFAGDVETKQIIGDGPTSTTTPIIEKTHGQNTGLEFTLGYSGQKVFIFKKLDYTFAVFDVKRYSSDGLPRTDWEAMLDSIVITEK